MVANYATENMYVSELPKELSVLKTGRSMSLHIGYGR